MTNCIHPNSERCKTATGAIICAACGTVTKLGYKETDFDPATMTHATPADIDRIWRELWGDATVLYILGRFDTESGEYLDLAQKVTKTG